MAIGVVGLGEMGGGFVERLLAAKFETYGWNRTRSKAEPYLAKGMKWADSPRALAERCEYVLTMVADDAALTAVTEGPDGILAGIGGHVLIEMSTIAPLHAQHLAQRVVEAGGAMLDAPVLGSQITLRDGKLVIMVGGDEAVLARARPFLEAIGPKVFHVGAIGQAKTMKIAVNLNLAAQMLALSEGLLLAVKSGIPRDTALDIMLGGVIGSPMLQYRAPLIKGQPARAMFDCTMMQKDVDLALELGKELGVPLPTTSTSDAWLTIARGQGLAHYDFSVLYYVLANAAGERLEVPRAT